MTKSISVCILIAFIFGEHRALLELKIRKDRALLTNYGARVQNGCLFILKRYLSAGAGTTSLRVAFCLCFLIGPLVFGNPPVYEKVPNGAFLILRHGLNEKKLPSRLIQGLNYDGFRVPEINSGSRC